MSVARIRPGIIRHGNSSGHSLAWSVTYVLFTNSTGVSTYLRSETDRAIHRPPLNLPKESVLSVASLCSPHWLCNQMHPSGHPAVIKVSTFSNLHFSQKLFLYSYCNREQCGLGRLGVSPGEECAKSGAKYAMAEVAVDCFPVPYGIYICNGVSGGIGEGTSLK